MSTESVDGMLIFLAKTEQKHDDANLAASER